jgi:tyrosyl-tRNA synthetase
LAEEHFKRVFQKREIPDDVSECEIPRDVFGSDGADMIRLLVLTGFASSNSDARRLISQGGVKVNGNRIDTFKISGLQDGDVVQAGRLKFARIRISRPGN